MNSTIIIDRNRQIYHPSRMTIGDRVKERMAARGISQAELGRRVGLTQPTIYNLIHRGKKGSTRLHSIARELGTTPAYLTGEVDDPDLDAPAPPTLTHEQTRWLALFEALDPSSRAALMHIAKTMVTGPQPTVNKSKEDSGEDA